MTKCIIGTLFALYGAFTVWVVWDGITSASALRAVQQACVLHGKVPAEVYDKIVCIDPEALR
jgi:hypothetical protein